MGDDQTTTPPAPATDSNAGIGATPPAQPPVDPAATPAPGATPNEEMAKDALNSAPLPSDPADTSVGTPTPPPAVPDATTPAPSADPMAMPPKDPNAPTDSNAGSTDQKL